MKVSAIAFLGTAVKDLTAERSFYANVLGLKDHGDLDGFAMLTTTDGDVVEFFDSSDPERAHFDRPVPGFAVEDLDAAVANLLRHGVPIIGSVCTGALGSRWVHCRTPNGLVIELLEPATPTAPGGAQ